MRKHVRADSAHLPGAARHEQIGWLAFFGEVSRALFPEEVAAHRPRGIGIRRNQSSLGDGRAIPAPQTDGS